jgi:hypothetical protein
MMIVRVCLLSRVFEYQNRIFAGGKIYVIITLDAGLLQILLMVVVANVYYVS